MCLSTPYLFKLDETDKTMTLVGKSCMYYILLAESTVQMIGEVIMQNACGDQWLLVLDFILSAAQVRLKCLLDSTICAQSL